jgi:hypothetical protein
MKYQEFVEEYLKKDISELQEIQEVCLYSLKTSLNKLSENMDFDPSKAYFIYMMLCVGCDKVCDEKEYELLHKFINPNVTLKMVNDYLPEFLATENAMTFVREMVLAIKSMSEVAYEEMMKIALCFLCANKDFSEEKKTFIETIQIEVD